MRTITGGRFEHAGAQTLAAHFHQAEAGDTTDLDTGTVVLERFFHRFFDLAGVRMMLLIDEIDDHQTSHVAQTQLASDFARCLEIGVKCRLLDIVLFGRASGVDVDRHQRFGRIDYEISARLKLNDRIVHGLQFVFRTVALEQRHRIRILFNPPCVAGHQQLHEFLGRFVTRFTFDHDFFDVAIVDVADCALDKVAVRMDQCRRAGGQGTFANFIPKSGKVIEVTLYFGLGAAEASRPNDKAHRFGQAQIGHDLLEPLAVRCRRDLAGNTATMTAVRHEHRVTPGQAEICR